MKNIISPQPPQQDVFPLPEFLGVSPDEGPERLPEEPWLSLCYLIDEIEKEHPGKDPGPTHDQFKKFIQAFSDMPYEDWKAAQTRFFAEPQLWVISPKLAWINYFRCLKLFESPDKEKIKAPLVKEKQLQPPSRNFLLLIDHLANNAPSPKKTKKLYLEVHGRCFNKNSKRGSKIYIYGQVEACKAAGLPLRKTKDNRTAPGRAFNRLWAWLVKHGFFNKRSNENPEAHTCATWYVCTSLAQRDHFRIPRDHPQKTGRRSPHISKQSPYEDSTPPNRTPV